MKLGWSCLSPLQTAGSQHVTLEGKVTFSFWTSTLESEDLHSNPHAIPNCGTSWASYLMSQSVSFLIYKKQGGKYQST